ncbi:3-dehydroquinate synthase [Campylobacter lari]|uniref:3-dehydroquinate synthase n=1 Tax=Campylobacter lari TaxID=201 RepID=UPI0012829BBF|nr:3-dehydroquinate synthase [Campylobacter lari]EAJ6452215.1 3-dehydroquinate synthase [Campylobacter lari]EAK0770675.1 3-dehydroquinate synthase [Campylobacter lari]EAK6011933.1 3-dehydroquinate synthase [Campylobacter lari]EAK9996834.1 3-dehydroquinate synthase [Campylobacter lari]EDP6858904.1 3-dehydroquinate synthase [Campylobacter lari]
MQVKVNLENNTSYNVYINELEKLNFDTKVVILTNELVAKLHLDTLLEKIQAKELFIIKIKDGEEYKNLQTIEYILNQMCAYKLDRKSLLISFGGGVISDTGGFVASIYQRGIEFINIPTTLLACVDASVGGKTGVNNKFGKNLIGTFYQPKAVYCESRFLKTLPSRELAAGMAEFIKMAVVFDETILSFLENLNEDKFLNAKLDDITLAQIIQKSIELKASVVSQDEKESGLRMLLNYGHTFAHVIENQTGYKKYLHGEAVAIGMNMANVLALNLGLLSEQECQRVQNLLAKFKLPISYKISNTQEFYNAFFLDKKTHFQKINFILACGLGKACIKNDISKEDILRTLEVFA